MDQRLVWIRRIIRILAAWAALPVLQSLARCLRCCLPTGRRGPTPPPDTHPANCQPMGRDKMPQPDPLIYDQYYLAAQGLAVTWDNPDIHLEQGGVLIAPHALQPNQTYDIVARIWNSVTNAPVAQLPVHFSYLSFGVGTTKTEIDTQKVDLGVKGSVHCPAFARQPWTTPVTPGHYCIQVTLDWGDDLNPANNLGQTNTDVQPLNSPRATFTFALRNPTRRALTFTLRADDYVIPARRPCHTEPALTPEQTEEERALRRRQVLVAHGRERYGLPAGWQIDITPAEAPLEPDEERTVTVVTNAPDGFVGRKAINVNAFAGETLIGGVTLYAEGAA